MNPGLLKTIWARVKWSVLILAAVAVLLGAVGVFLLGRGCGDRPRPAEPVSTATGALPGWVAPPEETTPWLPFKKNKASEYTAGFPAGSKVVRVETEKGEVVEIGILPDGQVVTKKGTKAKATVYVKRPALVAAEFRPFLFGGLGLGGVYGGGGVDLVRVWRLHGGVGAAATYWPDEEERDVDVGVIAKVSVNVWRNVDLVGGGGYGTAGELAFGGVSIGIE